MLNFILLSGSGETYLSTFISQNEACPSCLNEGSLQINFYQKYFRLYYIPTFPLKKTGNVLCSKCGFNAYIKDCSPKIKSEFELFKTEVETPIWTWVGTIVFGFFISLLTYSIINAPKKKKYDKLEVDDCFVYTPKEGLGFSTRKIIRITNDSIWAQVILAKGLEENNLQDYPYEDGDTLVYHIDEFKEDLKVNNAFEMK